MGLIHTRASKKRDKAAARLASDQSKVIERQARRAHQDEKQEKLADRQEAAQGKPWYRQPTVGDTIRASRQK
jgi:hypothetical protein